MLIRPITLRDLDPLYQIAVESGPGFTSLMPDRDALAQKIEHSMKSFERRVDNPTNEQYLFVLEDEHSHEIMGTTGIQASVGLDRPLHHFKRDRTTGPAGLVRETLTRCEHYAGCTEICSLYLRPDYRQANAGKLLSKVRFLFMAMHPERFANTVIAEMRGVSDTHGHSPFWNWLRHQVVDLDFSTVTQLSAQSDARFLEQLVPPGPFDIADMTIEAQAVIGQVHPDTRPALHLLKQEGFRHRGLVDLFDAGPTIECARDAITSVRNSGLYRGLYGGTRITAHTGFPLIVANGQCSGFRATIIDSLSVGDEPEQIPLPTGIQRKLGLNGGDPVWALPLVKNQPTLNTSEISAHQEFRHAQ